MKNFKIILSSLIFSLGVHAIANETTNVSPSIKTEENSSDFLKAPVRSFPVTKKTIYYGSLSIAPGIGVSFRERNGFLGTAWDMKIGAIPPIQFLYSKNKLIPVISTDFNLFLFSNETKANSFYFSPGVGAAYWRSYPLPYLSIRAGKEFKEGFIDIGTKIVYIPSYHLFPSPEIRTGINF